jgi:uncharacterized membrane protein
VRPEEGSQLDPSGVGSASVEGDRGEDPNREPTIDLPATLEAQFSAFIGPLPHPAVMQGYEDVLPGAAERIIALAEKQSAHRMGIESQVVTHESWRSWAGLVAGTVIALAILGGAIGLTISGHEEVGALLGIANIAGISSVFVLGRRAEQED